MKNQGLLFLLSISLPLFFSCTDDRVTPVNNDNESVNKWIYEKMDDYYLWYEELPDENKLSYSADPENFFYSLLSNKDGKSSYPYSYINKKSETTKAYLGDDLSLGFEYNVYVDADNSSYYNVLILYVLPDSPAEQAGLKRGDWIITINNTPVNMTLAQELKAGGQVQLGISDQFGGSDNLRTVSLTSTSVIDNPVFLSTTLSHQGKSIGYLVYNHFNSGRDDSSTYSEEFNNSLRKAFAEFATQSIDEFILDLRYNQGGKVTCAQLLATMLAPASALGVEDKGDIFCNLTYNEKRSSLSYSLKFDKSFMEKESGGKNLDLSRLYVITSTSTASASEAVINGLKPFMDVKIVGQQTEGKDVGSITFTEQTIDWEIHPIVCYVTNKNDYSNSDGFEPDYYFQENARAIYELGDPSDSMLAYTLQIISGNSPRSTSQPEDPSNLKMVYSSIEAKKKEFILLD